MRKALATVRFAPVALALLMAGAALAGTPPAKSLKTAPKAAVPAAKAVPAPPAKAVAAVPPPAAGNQVTRPNLWELKSGTLSVTYATSGIDGKPHLTYSDSGTTVNASGDEIRMQETEIGTLVSITIRRTVDSGSAAFSLLVPLVNMESAAAVVSVNVVGITTNHRFSPVPMMNRGQVQLGMPVVLNGTAKRVTF